MLTHKYVTWGLAIIMLTIIGFDFYYFIPVWVYLLPVFIGSLIIFYGAYFIDSNYFMDIVCKVNTPEKIIAITFDDGPVAGKTDKVLDILKTNQVTATFFCIGKNIPTQEILLHRIADEGHLIGNHSYSHHFFFDLYSSAKMYQELLDTNALIESVISKKVKWFRPPYGVTNPNLVQAIKKGDFIPIGWSVRSLDTVEKDTEKLISKITRNIQPGDIFLFHDTMEVTINGLQQFIDKVHQQGFKIVSLENLLTIKAYE